MATTAERARAGATADTIRWRIALLVSIAIAISYLDRQTLSVAIAAIQNDIPMTNTQFAHLNVAFLATYGVMYAGGGRLIDALGTRRGFWVIMVFWSLACASHGFANGVVMLAISRLLLGIGEGGGFPAATKVVAEWFPTSERSTAMGMINAGTAIGAVVAPPLIASIIGLAGWRWVFFVTGGIGLLWTVWWLLAYHPRQQVTEPQEHAGANLSWIGLFSYRETWGLVIAKFLSDAAWYFYLAWLPKYLYDVRNFDTKQVGYFAWIPYAAAGLGALAGGWFSSHLLTRGKSLNSARKIALGASAAMMPLIIFVTRSPIRADHRAVQHRVLRTAVLVHAGHDSAHRPVSAPRGRHP